MLEWHRLFGLMLTDYFTGTAYKVELEKDLSLKQQLLDVIIIEQEQGKPPDELPDGLEDLSKHNLMTYKSPRQPLDAWAIDELIGHYVNYRKQMSSSPDDLLPVEDIRLYGVCTREPQKLKSEVEVRPLQDGVYDVVWGIHTVKIIVLSQIPLTPNNAIWQVFSGIPEQVQYGVSQYNWHSDDHSTVMNQLYQIYCAEGMTMSYTFDDFYRDFTREHLQYLSIADRLQGLTTEEIVKYIPTEEILQHLRLKDILDYVKTQQESQEEAVKNIKAQLHHDKEQANVKRVDKNDT